MNEHARSSKNWLYAARSPDIVRRSTKVSLIVGTILVAINQGDVLLSGAFDTELLWKIPMTYCVPYAVSTYAAIDALLRK